MKMTSKYLKTSLTIALTLSAPTVLTACAVSNTAMTPHESRFPVEVAESIERLELYTRPSGLELSARDTDAVAVFLSGFKRHGSGQILVNIPSNISSGLGAGQAEHLIRSMVAQGGIQGNIVRTARYNVPARAPAPVVVSYKSLKTLPRDCRFMGNIMWTGTNQASDSYGCSQSANLAAMVQDPRQLIEPLPYGASSPERRTFVYDKYISGEATSSEFPDRQEISVEGN